MDDKEAEFLSALLVKFRKLLTKVIHFGNILIALSILSKTLFLLTWWSRSKDVENGCYRQKIELDMCHTVNNNIVNNKSFILT